MLKEQLELSITEILQTLGIEEIPNFKVEIPLENFGDFATNAAFLLSKKLRKNPREIAAMIIEELKKVDEIESVSVAGPGFININLSTKAYADTLDKILANRSFWKADQTRKVLFEFASVNPTGPFTVGHGRQAVYGDVLCNIFENAGYKVDREMYINDAGRQIKLLGRSLWVRYNELFGETVELPEDGYQGEYIIDIAKEIKESDGDSFRGKWDNEIEEFFKAYALKSMMKEMMGTMERLSIKFNRQFSEKSVVDDGTVESIINDFDSRNLTYEADNAKWFAASKFVNDSDKVIIRSNGTYTYFMTDIAYHYNKYKRGYEIAYDIWGADHVGHIPRMNAALNALEIPEGFLKVIMHQYVNLKKEDEIVKMSTRKGEFYTLDELIDAVGVDATRYFFAMFDPDTHMLFDIDLAKKKSNENPVFYVQYAYARISNIFKGAEEKGLQQIEGIDLSLLTTPEEKAIIKKLDLFPETLKNITDDYKTNRLTAYLEDVAGAFHSFYNKNIVVNLDEPELSAARLALCKAVRDLLEDGLNLLGVSAPKYM